jgi:hypothetical protein
VTVENNYKTENMRKFNRAQEINPELKTGSLDTETKHMVKTQIFCNSEQEIKRNFRKTNMNPCVHSKQKSTVQM